METKQTLTHSRMACFRACPRKHQIAYEYGIRKEEESLVLRVGSAFHLALELTDKGVDVTPEDLKLECPYDMAMVMAMFIGHREFYRDAESYLEVCESEGEFNLPLINPETGKPTPLFNLGGKRDRIIRLADGRLALQEYKTTSRDFAPGADYWNALHMDSQLSIYVIAARESGFDVQTVLYDVTKRPGLKPLKATPMDKRKYKKDGELYANQRDVDETPAEYRERISVAIAKDPSKYFARIEIARLDQDLDDCRADIWSQQLVIRSCQRLGNWWRNPGNCYGMFPCEYLPICQNRNLDVQTPDGFIRSANKHPELDGA